ncbi:NinH [Proteus mirabilis]
MQTEISSIPELLIQHRGNMNSVARLLGCYRHTVKKYAYDESCKYHVVLNGSLMTKTKMKGNQEGIL